MDSSTRTRDLTIHFIFAGIRYYKTIKGGATCFLCRKRLNSAYLRSRYRHNDFELLICEICTAIRSMGRRSGSEPNAHATCQWRGSKGFNATLPTYMLTKGLRGTFSVIIISQREGLSVRAYGLSYIMLKSSSLSSSCKAVKL